jgi:predicted RNase H-like HicB family nuclease
VLEYTVILHQDEEYGGYWVEVPSLVGCVSQGKTKEEALKNIREAIELHLECIKEDGEEIPREENMDKTLEGQYNWLCKSTGRLEWLASKHGRRHLSKNSTISTTFIKMWREHSKLTTKKRNL